MLKLLKKQVNEKLFYQEDVVFLLEYFIHTERVKLLKEAYYYYYKNLDSVTNNFEGAIKNLSSIYMIRNLLISILKKSSNKDYQDIIDQRFLNLLLMYFNEYQIKQPIKQYFRFLENVSDANREYFAELLKTNLNKKWKIFISLLSKKRKYLFYIYVKLYRLTKGK